MRYRAALTSPKIQALAAGSLSGLLAFLAFPPADLGLLGFVALVPLAWFFRRTDKSRDAALASTAFSFIFFGLLISWIHLFGLIAYVGLVTAQSLWMIGALQAAYLIKCRRPSDAWLGPLAFPVAFVCGEYLRTHLPLGGFGWGGLGYTQHDNPIALQLAPYTGVWGISFVVASINSLLAESLSLLRRQTMRAGASAAGALALGLAPVLLPVQQPDGERIRVAMVQADLPENTFDPRSDDLVVFRNHLRLTRSIEPDSADLVVWPEGAFDTDPFSDEQFRAPLIDIVREKRVPFLIGAILPSTQGKNKVRNSTLFLDPNGKVEGVYSKQHPVPFGEFVPFREILTPLVKELERVPNDQVPGQEPTVFQLPQGKIASVICYESTYPGLVRSFIQSGAGLLVVSTNDSSFERTPASEQHAAFSQLRAAEHRVWVAHTAVSGISAVVRPDGKVLEKSSLFEPEIFLPTMRFTTSKTFYAKAGDWLCVVLLFTLVCLAAYVIPKRAQGPERQPAQFGDRGREPAVEQWMDQQAPRLHSVRLS